MIYPGIYREEIDNTLVSTIDNSTRVAVVGKAKKGIANAVTLIRSEAELIEKFGTPIISGSYPIVSAIDYGIYAGIEALKETSNLYYVRATNGTERYSNIVLSAIESSAISATSASTNSVTLNAYASSAYPDTNSYVYGNSSSDIREITEWGVLNGTRGLGVFSIGPGVYGNNVGIRVTNYGVSAISALSANFDWANVYGDIEKSKRVVKIDVYVKNDSDTSFSNLVETFYVSNSMVDVDNSGNSLFAEDVINGKSQYIYVRAGGNGTVIPGTFNSTTLNIVALGNGADAGAGAYTESKVWAFFQDGELYPVDIFVPTPRSKDQDTDSSDLNELVALVGKRLDCIVPLQVGKLSDTKLEAIKSSDKTITSNPSYFAKYAGWNLIFDRYNASRLYLPNSIYAAAVMARTDRVGNPWEAPAGKERGVIPSGKQNLFITADGLGRLYKENNINTIKFIADTGNVIWGQKTAQLKQTARDRINVRRMLLYVQKNCTNILNGFLFRGNTDRERERVTALISAFMDTVKIGDGVQAVNVICDSSNNTSDTIARNEMYVDIIIVPTYVTEFIKLRTTLNQNSVSVTEL